MKKTKVISFYSGPGGGKSTLAARTFSELKDLGYNCELITEYAKDVTWEQSFAKLENQIYVFGKQHHRMWRLNGKVDFMITDSPLLLSIIYGETSDTFKSLVIEEYQKYDNVEIFLNRVKPYNTKGRSQSEDEAKVIDRKLYELVNSMHPDRGFDIVVDGQPKNVSQIIEHILKNNE
jgi:hypothetical protein